MSEEEIDRAAAVRRVMDRSGHKFEDLHHLWTNTIVKAALEHRTKLQAWEVYGDE